MSNTSYRPLPCPRCGAEAGVEVRADDSFAVVCNAVLCRIIGPRRPSHREAVETWNARPAAHVINKEAAHV